MDRPVRRLRMEHGLNISDMGGFETNDGRVTAFGKLLRAGASSKADTAGSAGTAEGVWSEDGSGSPQPG